MAHLSHIPTRSTVSLAWERYRTLALAVANDPVQAADPVQQIALKRAHDRWAKAFTDWNGQ